MMNGLYELESCPIVGEVQGVGFLYGIEIVANKETKEPVSENMMLSIIGACKKSTNQRAQWRHGARLSKYFNYRTAVFL